MVEIWRHFDWGLRSAINFESWLPYASHGSTEFRQRELRSVFPDCTQSKFLLRGLIELPIAIHILRILQFSVHLSPSLVELWGADHRGRVNEGARRVSS